MPEIRTFVNNVNNCLLKLSSDSEAADDDLIHSTTDDEGPAVVPKPIVPLRRTSKLVADDQSTH